MTDSIFKHKDCGGNVYVDISAMFIWPTPSLSFTQEGIVVGITEFRASNTNTKKGPILRCSECGKTWNFSEAIPELEVECQVCQEVVPLNEAGSNRQIQCACSSCQKVMTGSEKPANPRQQKIVEFIYFGSHKGISFVSFAEMLKKPIRF